MKQLYILMISIFLTSHYAGFSQNISGTINNYAAVTALSGAGVSVSTATAAAAFIPGDRVLVIQMKGAIIDQSNTPTFGNITSLNGAGTFEFATVSSSTGTTITLASALTNTYNLTGDVQIVRVPKFCNPTVTSSLSCPFWNPASKTGGVLAFEAGTLTLNADIDVSEKGFGGGNFTAGSFLCDNGNFAAAAGSSGGFKGESISEYISNLNGLKGKQANGGGASNSGNSGGGGGGNGGFGGLGGNQYNDCDSTFDERGVGGLNLNASFSALFMGGGGGGGFKDNGLVATKGGNGGGIIYIKADAIICNSHTISSNGGNVTILSDAEGAGGGGAGGTIFIECNNITGNLAVKANGGFGGSNNNSAFVTFCHGTGGGGGGGVFAYSAASLSNNITYSSTGGLAGTVNNTASACYGTTYGATQGDPGISLPGLSSTALQLSPAPTLSISEADSICKGETVNITVSGGANYYWSNGATGSVTAVSPSVTSIYTITGAGVNANSCQASITTTLTVFSCTGLQLYRADAGLITVYPNPTNGKLSIDTKATVKITLCDGLGKTMMERTLQKGSQELNLTDYAPGLYLLKVMNGSEGQVLKIIKTE